MIFEIGAALAITAIGEYTTNAQKHRERDHLISLGKWCFAENEELTVDECPCKMCVESRENDEDLFFGLDLEEDEE